MATLEQQIDDLYKLPLPEFVPARTALAKTLSGNDAKRVKALAKPTVLPWAVNQLYWRARSAYDRLLRAGEKVRATQISALKGRAGDLPAATAAHRQAVGEAVAAATRAAADGGHDVATDGLARMLEAVSLSETTPEPPGRFTKPLQPAGFEALAGIPIKAPTPARKAHTEREVSPPAPAQVKGASAADRRAEARRLVAERERAAAAERAIKKAEAALDRARAAEERARKAWQHAKAEADMAGREFDKLRQEGRARQDQ